jgi:hypothetical protein
VLSDLRFPYTIFTLQASFKPVLLGGGGGVKPSAEVAFVPTTSKNSASVQYTGVADYTQ